MSRENPTAPLQNRRSHFHLATHNFTIINGIAPFTSDGFDNVANGEEIFIDSADRPAAFTVNYSLASAHLTPRMWSSPISA
ncbi:hypothetical protein [Poriferisphaera sp. WC338]|uniref:hypothetical protein n=1 Tax=Poriferisphaera sp. WC338 TaxID=3425129 RepID=UPI003D814EB8